MSVLEPACRLLLLADGAVGAAVVQYLVETYPDDLVAIVTTASGEISDHASAHGIRTLAFSTEAALLDDLGDAEINMGLLAWWPHILQPGLLARPSQGFVNTHPSLLPYDRGKNPNFWAIVEQAPFGVSLHQVTPGIDDGAILAQDRIAYDWTDTGGTLYEKARAAMTDLVVDTYPTLRAGPMAPRSQNVEQGSFHRASEIDPASRIDLDAPTTPRALLNRIRARTFDGYPACTFVDDGETFEVRTEIIRRPI